VLSPEELNLVEATLLPALERHHLRLLAHGLRTLQQISGARSGDLPSAEAIRHWVMQQHATAGDEAFADAFSSQLVSLGDQLQGIAGPTRQALGLDLPALITWARHQADARLAAGGQAI
jgi:hypothetical protein